MKLKFILCLLLSGIFFQIKAQQYSIIPQPVMVIPGTETFDFSYSVNIVFDKEQNENADYLNQYLAKYYSVRPILGGGMKKKIALRNPGIQTDNLIQHDDEYTLSITGDSIIIKGSSAGVFYGIQTLLQLMPAEKISSFQIPCCDIHDYPRFSWRGMHLDCARHFFSVEFVKKYIDMMAYYKLNMFHWHLTDDQGWRIEIKQYPLLTQIGSYRKETMVEKNFDPYIGDKTPVDGFYTQEQVKEIVQYAAKRHITIVPEIEMPGHSQAAIAAYPELACYGNNYEVWTKWGVTNVTLCPTSDVIQFYENILSEIISLFPGKYIHIGGDEVPDDHWKNSKQVAELMHEKNLQTYAQVEAYFINQIEQYVISKGKKIIGWDEILEGGVSQSATIMSWRGTEGGVAAAKKGNDAVMTPGKYCYFDHCQSQNPLEPICIGGYLPLDTVYSYDPMPSQLSADESMHILGAQANVWTEYISTGDKIEYMIFPRMLALSEVLWTQKKNMDYWNFIGRLEKHFELLNMRGINYRVPDVKIEVRTMDGNKFMIGMSCIETDAMIHYTLDGSNPTETSLSYLEPLTLTAEECKKLKAIAITKSGKRSLIISN